MKCRQKITFFSKAYSGNLGHYLQCCVTWSFLHLFIFWPWLIFGYLLAFVTHEHDLYCALENVYTCRDTIPAFAKFCFFYRTKEVKFLVDRILLKKLHTYIIFYFIYILAASPLASSGFAAIGCFRLCPMMVKIGKFSPREYILISRTWKYDCLVCDEKSTKLTVKKIREFRV